MSRLKYLAAVCAVVAEVALVISLVCGASLSRENATGINVRFVGSTVEADSASSAGPRTAPQGVYSFEADVLAQRWGISKIGVPQAWQVTRGDPAITVAVLDTGIDEGDQALAGKVVAEVNLTDSPTSKDLYGHGTHVAGTIAAIAPECSLMNVKVADDAGRCEAATVARGILWAVEHGAKVINISLCMEGAPELEEAVNYAWAEGAIIIAAAGNRGKEEPVYPACYENCVAVASTNENDSLALLSNHGDWVDVAAPGFNIYAELPGNQYGYKSGTSSAVAHVSGIAALVFSVAEDRNGNGSVNDEVRWAIESSCVPMAGEGVGKGRVDALGAVMKVAC